MLPLGSMLLIQFQSKTRVILFACHLDTITGCLAPPFVSLCPTWFFPQTCLLSRGAGGFSVTSIVLCCFGTFSTTWYLVPPKNCLEPLFHYVRSIRWQADCNMNSINSLIYMQNDSIDIVTFSKRWGGVIPSVNEPFKKDNNAAKSISCRQCTL
jgi:hypothetical protein